MMSEPHCAYCGRYGLKCPFCSVGWMIKKGKYRQYQRYGCKNCKKTLSIRGEQKQ